MPVTCTATSCPLPQLGQRRDLPGPGLCGGSTCTHMSKGLGTWARLEDVCNTHTHPESSGHWLRYDFCTHTTTHMGLGWIRL